MTEYEIGKNKLEQIQRLKTLIFKKMQKAEALRTSAEGVDAIRYDKPSIISSPSNFTETAIIDLTEVEAEIEELEQQLDNLKLFVYENIKKIDDDEEQAILINRYYDDLSWRAIANKMNKSETGIFALHDVAIFSLGLILKSLE